MTAGYSISGRARRGINIMTKSIRKTLTADDCARIIQSLSDSRDIVLKRLNDAELGPAQIQAQAKDYQALNKLIDKFKK